MKKEKLFQLLKERYSSFGLGDEFLKTYADSMLSYFIPEEEEMTDYVGMQYDILKNFQRIIEKRVSDAINKTRKEQVVFEREVEIKARLAASIYGSLAEHKGTGVLEYLNNFTIEATNDIYKGICRKEEKSTAIQRLDDYQSLCDEIRTDIKEYHVNDVAGALMNPDSFVSLQVAKSLSNFYGRVPLDTIRAAFIRGEIDGNIPDMERKHFNKYYNGEKIVVSRLQPTGKYELKVQSLVRWLEKHYSRRVNKESMANKYINKMV